MVAIPQILLLCKLSLLQRGEMMITIVSEKIKVDLLHITVDPVNVALSHRHIEMHFTFTKL